MEASGSKRLEGVAIEAAITSSKRNHGLHNEMSPHSETKHDAKVSIVQTQNFLVRSLSLPSPRRGYELKSVNAVLKSTFGGGFLESTRTNALVMT